MRKKTNSHYKEILTQLQELKTRYPSYSLGMHLSTIIDDYGDIWGITDKEFAYAVTKYMAKLEMDVPRETSKDEIDQIIRDGMNLTINSEEE